MNNNNEKKLLVKTERPGGKCAMGQPLKRIHAISSTLDISKT